MRLSQPKAPRRALSGPALGECDSCLLAAGLGVSGRLAAGAAAPGVEASAAGWLWLGAGG